MACLAACGVLDFLHIAPVGLELQSLRPAGPLDSPVAYQSISTWFDRNASRRGDARGDKGEERQRNPVRSSERSIR
jgi:hypothetical protein